MYNCDIHGEVINGWCDDCQKVVHCDCSDMDRARFKDLHLEYNNGCRTFTIYVNHCMTCGFIESISE